MSLVRSIRAVAWSFLGVRGQSGYEDDLAKIHPFTVIAVGFVGALVFIGVLLAIVHWVVAPA